MTWGRNPADEAEEIRKFRDYFGILPSPICFE
jgi:hypothetical protein